MRPRYSLVRGSYHGTTDDRAGGWYVVDGEADIIDKRGRGFATRREALDSLVRDIDDDLVSVKEIAARAETTPGTIHSWRRRHADTFPRPVVTLAIGPVWWWEDIEAWVAIERKPGRPRKG